VGLLAGGLLLGGAWLVSERKAEDADSTAAQVRVAELEQQIALARAQPPQQYATNGSSGGGALNGVANVLQALGGASGITTLGSFILGSGK
jgi:hypothetical protein